jgi:uncharacterized membrane protein (UPF0136 family)
VNAILIAHIAAGSIAVLAGYLAVTARKGGRVHALAGTWFFGSMLLLGVTASVLEPFRTPQPGSPIGGIMVCYFVATSWMAARRRDGRPGLFEKIACGAVLAMAAAMIWGGISGTVALPGPSLALGCVCLLAGLLDLNFILRGKLSGVQRIARHLWRMCFAFFVATGSFFLGQQKVFPEVLQGSPLMWVLALAPFGFMLFWLVRIRLAKTLGRSAEALRQIVRPGAGVPLKQES